MARGRHDSNPFADEDSYNPFSVIFNIWNPQSLLLQMHVLVFLLFMPCFWLVDYKTLHLILEKLVEY